ncbi:unnamed protein product [Spirodela intermedia]|uniref:RING-CH-type domain-containing protein n=1 Tax=Spirodela intermedia TaxID=51605 RepID=A0A7I8JJG4_SPIIN|nr:unnamed protein product [Spirodela intermedia]CAA6669925.1 unnamed protein product [Spirodela intermedia]
MESSGAPAETAVRLECPECNGGEIQPAARSRRSPNLTTLQIPARPSGNPLPAPTRVSTPSLATPTSTRSGLPPRPNSTRTKGSVRNLNLQRSFPMKSLSLESEKSGLLASGASPLEEPQDRPSTSRSISLTRVFLSAKTKRTLSLPVTRVAGADNVPEQDGHAINLSRSNPRNVNQIKRSMSVPGNMKGGTLDRMYSLGGWIRVIPATPCPIGVHASSTNDITLHPQEDAVCRICFVELAEGGETLKMECSCKGELALAHKECAVKWFSIKGNKTCDICKQEVQNLPVTLTRIQTTSGRRQPSTGVRQRQAGRHRVLQDIPVLVIVSMLAYFCFLEQLLVTSMGSRALALSLPFSFALGLLSSMIASTMVSISYIWAFASFQFAAIILFAHIFYDVLEVAAVLSVLLSSFTGFGISICVSSLLMEFLRWRTRRRLRAAATLSQNGGHRHQAPPREDLVTEAAGSGHGQQESGSQTQLSSSQPG